MQKSFIQCRTKPKLSAKVRRLFEAIRCTMMIDQSNKTSDWCLVQAHPISGSASPNASVRLGQRTNRRRRDRLIRPSARTLMGAHISITYGDPRFSCQPPALPPLLSLPPFYTYLWFHRHDQQVSRKLIQLTPPNLALPNKSIKILYSVLWNECKNNHQEAEANIFSNGRRPPNLFAHHQSSLNQQSAASFYAWRLFFRYNFRSRPTFLILRGFDSKAKWRSRFGTDSARRSTNSTNPIIRYQIFDCYHCRRNGRLYKWCRTYIDKSERKKARAECVRFAANTFIIGSLKTFSADDNIPFLLLEGTSRYWMICDLQTDSRKQPSRYVPESHKHEQWPPEPNW